MNKISEQSGRPKIEFGDIQIVRAKNILHIKECLDEKGDGSWLSSHECLGIVTEEFWELVEV